MSASPPPEEFSRADLERMAAGVLGRVLAGETVPRPQLDAALACYPRTRPAEPTTKAGGAPTGFATVHMYRTVKGDLVADDEPPPGARAARAPGST